MNRSIPVITTRAVYEFVAKQDDQWTATTHDHNRSLLPIFLLSVGVRVPSVHERTLYGLDGYRKLTVEEWEMTCAFDRLAQKPTAIPRHVVLALLVTLLQGKHVTSS